MKHTNNKLRSKILKTTVATTLAFGTLSALPLSSNSVLDSLGFQNVASASEQDLKDWISDVVGNYLFDENERGILREVRSNFAELDEGDIEPFIDAVEALLEGSIDPNLTADKLLELFTALGGIFYSDDLDGFDTYFVQIEDTLNSLGTLTNAGSIEKEDVFAFIEAVKNAVDAKIDKDFIVEVLTSPDSFENKVRDVLESVITDLKDNNSLKLANVINNLNIDQATLIDIIKGVQAVVDEDSEGSKLLALALVRSEAEAKTTNTSNDGRTKHLNLYVKGQQIPVNLLSVVYTNSNDVNATIDSPNGIKVQLKSGKTQANTTISVMIDHNIPIFGGKTIVLSESVSLQASSSGGSGAGGGGGGGGSSSVIEHVHEVADLVSGIDAQLESLESGLEEATDVERAQLLREVTAEINALLQQLTYLDASALVETVGDRAIATISAADLADRLADIEAQVAQWEQKLDALGGEIADLELTIRIGTPTSESARTSLSGEAIEAISNAGIRDVSIEAYEVATSVPVTELNGQTTVTVEQQVVDSTSNLPSNVLSHAYTVQVQSGGKQLTNLSELATVSFTIPEGADVDLELLSIVRLNGGEREVLGGFFNDTEGSIRTSLDDLSGIFIVIENKVSFDDVGQVTSWAGRQIDVIAAKGIIEGRGDGEFDPMASVTRAEFTKMLVQTFGLFDRGATTQFNDVASDAWYAGYVASAVQTGIVNGRSAEIFDPQGEISREEMATMAGRALKSLGISRHEDEIASALAWFNDADLLTEGMAEDVAFATLLGIVIGQGDDLFNPDGTSTRAESAVVMYRLFQLIQ